MVKIYNERKDYAPENPISKYKEEKRLSWEKISDESGVCINTLINVAKMKEDELDNIPFKTYKRIRYYLGIDMYEYDSTIGESSTL